jgi:hypothetical protein
MEVKAHFIFSSQYLYHNVVCTLIALRCSLMHGSCQNGAVFKAQIFIPMCLIYIHSPVFIPKVLWSFVNVMYIKYYASSYCKCFFTHILIYIWVQVFSYISTKYCSYYYEFVFYIRLFHVVEQQISIQWRHIKQINAVRCSVYSMEFHGFEATCTYMDIIRSLL